ncbi:hypothetical protein FHL15_006062 [Xylaria flabelliformis]|uniref:Nephrocystin 3-like N-terminal domain-containing protein n=1 Tax=Xylaria flabelliformis TaxID=2512241 RepID=A0A553HY99_9PEZI|nr:hypothetical protein FHL15_006062 [Xylaria flabelliformis]
MADPASTIGIVAAAIQFFDFSTKLYRTFQEIRRSAESATERNERLETDIRRHLTSTRPEDTDPHTTSCTSTANELLKLLEHVRGSEEQISSFRAFTRAILKRKEIEKLDNSFKECQAALNRTAIQNLPPSIDRLGVQQSVGFTTVNNKLDSIDHGIQLQTDVRKHDNLLERLRFPELNKRLEEIKSPATDTLNWLFESSTSYPNPDSGRVAKWPDFRQWLREDASTYWISGKAGSGKSTLMAYILEDRRTRKDLATWSDGYELVVLQFFFWRAGSERQRSIPGLLRSLLYQLCNRLCNIQPTAADFMDRISDTLRDSNGVLTFTEKKLRSAIVKAIQSCDRFRFCIFIDGLDEFLPEQGSYDDLVDCIEELQGPNNVKICVSSRPELDFVKRFQNIKKLRLQDLNESDIEKFVKLSFENSSLEEVDVTIRDIVRRAEGVFLWASLVTRSLVDGIKHGDSKEEMQTRLNELPDDIDLLYERMLSGIDKRYMSSLSFYVQIMKVITEAEWAVDIFPLSIIATSRLSKNINSYEEFAEECELTTTRIISRSAGLLEFSEDTMLDKAQWESVVPKFVSNQPRFTYNFERLNRLKCDETLPYPTMLKYEDKFMTWVHRSAYEYLTSRQLVEFTNHEDILRQLGEASLAYAVAAPSVMKEVSLSAFCYLRRATLMTRRLVNTLFFAGSIYKQYPTTASGLLDRLYSVFKQCDLEELHGVRFYSWVDTSNEFTGEIAFWSECAISHCWSYMSSRMDRILHDTACGSLMAKLLAYSIECFVQPKGMLQYADPVGFLRFADSLAEHFYRRTIQRFEVDDITQNTKFRYISLKEDANRPDALFSLNGIFGHAAWKGPVTDEHTMVMSRLVYVLGFVFRNGTGPHIGFLHVPAPLTSLMDATDLHVAPNIALKQICIQISGRDWIMADFGKREARLGTGHRMGVLGLAVQVNRAIRILCVPSLKCQGVWEPDSEPGSHPISFQPSAASSHQLLSLIGYEGDILGFFLIPGTRQQREKVCNRLLEEIVSAEQGLDEDQQQIAIACVRAGLLDSTEGFGLDL